MPRREPLFPKQLQITDTARADIREIIDYLASEADAAVAEAFLRRIDAELTTLAELGHSGVSREWINPGLRLHVIGNYCALFPGYRGCYAYRPCPEWCAGRERHRFWYADR
jgi:plasmid stabilization system protein ParE